MPIKKLETFFLTGVAIQAVALGRSDLLPEAFKETLLPMQLEQMQKVNLGRVLNASDLLGYLLIDKEKHLEGSGKYRRHLKIRTKKDVKIKMVEKFVSESFNLNKYEN